MSNTKSPDIKSLKIKIGSAIAHGTYLDEDAREQVFEEIIKAITALIEQREVEARLLDLHYLYAIKTDDINVIAREVESLIKSLTPKESL